ncbi:MAG TPA: DCC1-like thiol-disulfide oxidoreductase family protein, partial [Candidatus Didemnitutus sp.]|nr:DCC1-like thiol-disulfide oxidoreductase family protein [Candidatus Didemnitutus sp.]
MSTPTSIVVFDGVCNLCNTTVDFLIRHDRSRTLRYGSFQSEHVATLLRSHNITETPTTVYVITPDNTVLTQSTAIIYLGYHLGGIWTVMSAVATIIPRPLR